MSTRIPQIHFVDARQAAEMLGVSAMTIHRWRKIGFMPSPVYASGNITLFWRESLDLWISAGQPWCDKARGKDALDQHGIDAVAQWLKGEPDRDDVRLDRIADATERFLNESGRFVATADELKQEMRATRELIAARN